MNVRGTHGRILLPSGVGAQLRPQLAQRCAQVLVLRRGQLPDVPDAQPCQCVLCRAPHVKQRVYGQRPHDTPEIFRVDDRHSVRLFIIRPQLGKYLVEADAHRDGEAGLGLHGPADGVGHAGGRAAEQPPGLRHVQPAFVDSERLYTVCITGIDGVDGTAHLPVLPVVRGQQLQAGALAQRAPDGFGRLDAVPLCGLVFRQDDAMAVVRAAAYGHGHAAQLRVAQQLYRGIKAVAVAVKDHALFFRQIRRPPLRNSTGRFTAGAFSTQLSVCAPALRRRRAVRPAKGTGGVFAAVPPRPRL